jgi:hypothetical protein
MARPSKRQMSVTGAAIGSFILFGLGFLTCLLMLESVYFGPRRLAREAADWITVPCTIVDVGVAVVSLPPVRGGSRSGSPGYEPSVVYDYVVDGQSYQGESFWFRNVFCNTREEALEALVGFEKGKPADCFVDPKNPTRSILVREFSPGGGVLMLVPFVLATITGLGMVGIPWAIWSSQHRRNRWRRPSDAKSTNDPPIMPPPSP